MSILNYIFDIFKRQKKNKSLRHIIEKGVFQPECGPSMIPPHLRIRKMIDGDIFI